MKHLTPEARIQKFRPKIEFLECFENIWNDLINVYPLSWHRLASFSASSFGMAMFSHPVTPSSGRNIRFQKSKNVFFEVEDLKKTKKCEEDFLELAKMMSCHIFLSLLRAAISLPLDSPSLLRLTPPRSSKNLSRFLKLGLNDFLISSKMNIFTQKLKKNCSFVS